MKRADGRERLRRAFSEVMPLALSEEAAAEVCSAFAKAPKKMTVAQAIAMAQVKKALTGDSKAYETIRQTLTEESGEPGGVCVEVEELS